VGGGGGGPNKIILRIRREVGLKNLSNGVLIKEIIQKWEVPCWSGGNKI
jgi:hypothetical protein